MTEERLINILLGIASAIMLIAFILLVVATGVFVVTHPAHGPPSHRGVDGAAGIRND